MGRAAQHLPSMVFSENTEIMNAHFRTECNNETVLMGLKNFQICTIQTILPIIQTLIIERGAAFAICTTNITIRPIKLLVDTGASLTLVAAYLIKHSVYIQPHKLNSFGVTGSEFKIQTEGIVHGQMIFPDNSIGMAMHLVDKKYAGVADGYLGFDFLCQYKATINIAEKRLIYEIHKVCTKKPNLTTEDAMKMMDEASESMSIPLKKENEKSNFSIRILEDEIDPIISNYGKVLSDYQFKLNIYTLKILNENKNQKMIITMK